MGGSNIVKVHMVRQYQSNIRAGFPFRVEMQKDATIKDLKEACIKRNRKINPTDLKIKVDKKYLDDNLILK